MAGRPNTHGGYCLEEVITHLSCPKEVIGGILQEVRRVDTWMRTGMSGAQLPIPAVNRMNFIGTLSIRGALIRMYARMVKFTRETITSLRYLHERDNGIRSRR